MTALCPWPVLPEDAQSHSGHHGEGGPGKMLITPRLQAPVKKFSVLVVQCFEGHNPGVPLSSGTTRSLDREQRVAATKKSPTVLLCTICFGPSNAIHWAGQEGMTLGIAEVGATCAPGVWSLSQPGRGLCLWTLVHQTIACVLLSGSLHFYYF